jgi:hypothetical protein
MVALLAWPLLEQRPDMLREAHRPAERGPAAERPSLTAEERAWAQELERFELHCARVVTAGRPSGSPSDPWPSAALAAVILSCCGSSSPMT